LIEPGKKIWLMIAGAGSGFLQPAKEVLHEPSARHQGPIELAGRTGTSLGRTCSHAHDRVDLVEACSG